MEEKKKFYAQNSEDVIAELGTSQAVGLTSDEVERRQATFGMNKLAAPPGKSLIRRFVEQMIDPMIIILLVAALVSLVLSITQGGELCGHHYHFGSGHH